MLPRVSSTPAVLPFRLFHEFKPTAPLWFLGSQGQCRPLKPFSNLKQNLSRAALTGCVELVTHARKTARTSERQHMTRMFVRFSQKYRFATAAARQTALWHDMKSARHKQAGESASAETDSEPRKTPRRMKRPRDLWGFTFVGLRTLGVLGGRRAADMKYGFLHIGVMRLFIYHLPCDLAPAIWRGGASILLLFSLMPPFPQELFGLPPRNTRGAVSGSGWLTSLSAASGRSRTP